MIPESGYRFSNKIMLKNGRRVSRAETSARANRWKTRKAMAGSPDAVAICA
jgi:hypothetical protein